MYKVEATITGVNNLGSKKYKSIKVGDKITLRTYVENDKITVAPKVKVQKANNNSLLISWDENPSATRYDVYKSENKKSWTRLTSTTTTSYTNTGLTYGKTYYYKVRAVNSVSNKWSAIVSGKPVPNRVSLSIASAGTNNVKLSWNKENVTGYEIYTSTDNKKWSKLTTTYNKTKLTSNKVYYYKARAYKTVSGKKVYGSYSVVVSTRTAPEKPKVVLAIKDFDAMNLRIYETKGATRYIVEKGTDGKTYERIEDLPGAGLLAQSEQELGKTYYFRVRTCNSQTRCSGWTVISKKQTTKVPSFTKYIQHSVELTY